MIGHAGHITDVPFEKVNPSDLVAPQYFSVTADLWHAAAVLGGLRRASNEPHRKPDRDRGQAKNQLNDVMGSVTELIAIGVCERLPAVVVEHHLLDLYGSLDEVDLILRRDNRALALEAKGHFLASNKSFFAVNQRAHERSLDRGATHYMPIVAAMGSAVVRVGRLIPASALHSWPVHDFGHSDPAIAIDLEQFCRTYLEADLPEIRRQTASRNVAQELTLINYEVAGYSALGLARSQQFGLDGLPLDSVVQALLSLAPR